jgi:hypothetical protein
LNYKVDGYGGRSKNWKFLLSKEINLMKFEGVWNIYEMEMWDEHYFNIEVQAFIKITNDSKGDFQFGLVTGDFTGKIIEQVNEEKFAFKWIGTDELEPVQGSGWIEIFNEDFIVGKFTFDNGEQSKFKAKK